MTDTPKRFEEWEEVDCNECSHYWDSSCDGAKDSRIGCNSYLATRSVVLPAKIKHLENWNKWLTFGFICVTVLIVCHVIFQDMGWL